MQARQCSKMTCICIYTFHLGASIGFFMLRLFSILRPLLANAPLSERLTVCVCPHSGMVHLSRLHTFHVHGSEGSAL